MKLARSFKRNNERRIELLRQCRAAGLTEAETAELARVAAWCDRWVDARYPLPRPPADEWRLVVDLYEYLSQLFWIAVTTGDQEAYNEAFRWLIQGLFEGPCSDDG